MLLSVLLLLLSSPPPRHSSSMSLSSLLLLRRVVSSAALVQQRRLVVHHEPTPRRRPRAGGYNVLLRTTSSSSTTTTTPCSSLRAAASGRDQQYRFSGEQPPSGRAAFVPPPAASTSSFFLGLDQRRGRPSSGGWGCLRSASTTTTTATEASSFSSSSFQRTAEEVRMGHDARLMIQSALEAVDPYQAVTSKLQLRWAQESTTATAPSSSLILSVQDGNATGQQVPVEYNARDYDQIVVVGFGKACAAMATAVLHVLTGPTEATKSTATAAFSKEAIKGLVIVKDGHVTSEQLAVLNSHNVAVREASHPVPDQRSVDASNELLQLVKDCSSATKERTLVICCISGGGSSLFCSPTPPLTLDDLQHTNQVLLRSGWDIRDMNTVRKQLEAGKGGRLAACAAYPGRLLSLVLSDVIGDPLDLIASGPTVPNPTTAVDALALIEQKGFPSHLQLPMPVLDLLKRNADRCLHESHNQELAQPSASHPAFRTSRTILVGNNGAAVHAAATKAVELGYHPVVLTTQMTGEASQVAPLLVSMAHQLQSSNTNSSSHPSSSLYPVAPQLLAALIMGGETTVTLPPNCTGLGGRNQELALQAAVSMRIMGLRNVVLASVGTDGGDGPTDAAGAIVDGATIERLGQTKDAEMALKGHDAYPYLSRTDDSGWSPLLKTGPTGTNVADICLLLVHEAWKQQRGF